MEHLNPGQINNVTAKCSFGKRCDGLQAHSGSNNEFEQSRFSVIYYVCQPGKCHDKFTVFV